MSKTLHDFHDAAAKGKHDHPLARKIVSAGLSGGIYQSAPQLARLPKEIREAVPADLTAKYRSLTAALAGVMSRIDKFSYENAQLEYSREVAEYANTHDTDHAPVSREEKARQFRMKRTALWDQFVAQNRDDYLQMEVDLNAALISPIESFIEKRLTRDEEDSKDCGTELPPSPLVISLAAKLAGLHYAKQKAEAMQLAAKRGELPNFSGFNFELARQLGIAV